MRLRRHRHRHAHRPQSVRLTNFPPCSISSSLFRLYLRINPSPASFCFCFCVRSWSTSSVSFALRNHTLLNWSLFFFGTFGLYIRLFLASFIYLIFFIIWLIFLRYFCHCLASYENNTSTY
jgi:hypothetical protein